MFDENRFNQYKEIIKKVIAKGVTNYNTQFEVYSLLKGIESEFGLEDKDIRDYVMKISKQVHAYSEYMAGHDVANSDKYSELYWQFLLFEAPHIFDSYLLYLEKKREPSAKFYEPKKRQLNKFGLIQSMQDLEDDKLDLLSISMPPGTQKCQPLYSKVLTPNGFVTMGELSVGDKVIAGNGNVATVLSMSPINKRPIYEITFDDGSKTRCSDNHLWRVQNRYDRKVGKYRNITTEEMIPNLYCEHGRRKTYSIDYVERIEMPEKEFIIHPYVMGVILGDGGLSGGGVKVSIYDMEILGLMNELLPKGYSLKHICKYDYRVNGHEGNNAKAGSLVTKEMKKYGLYGKKSIHKFVPKEYLNSSYEQRLELLRGLLDTDGSASESYCTYSTISEQLALDVIELVHSLGGYASVQKKKSGYKDKDGNYIQCNDSYNILIQFNSKMDCVFKVKRKAGVYRPKRDVIKRFVESIEYVGEEDCRCIYISDPCHLYITDDYIITHNTTLEKFFTTWVIGRHPDDYSLFFSHSSDVTKMYYEGVLDILTNDIEYTWNEIFPGCKVTKTDAKREQININRYKPFPNLQTSSVGSKNAGKVRCNRYLLNDDLIAGIEEALNKNRLDKLWNIYSVDARQRKLNQQVKEIHIATRWSVHDVIGRLQRAYVGDERKRFIAIPDIDPITGESNFDYDYNGMSVEFFHDQEKLMDEISYKCLYKNEPIEREGLLYNEDELRRYLTLPLGKPDAVLGICDTKEKGSDYMFLPCVYQYGNDYYAVDCICDNNSDYGIQYERLSDIIIRNKMQKLQVEQNVGGGRIAYELAKRVEPVWNGCNITTRQTTKNKETKIIVNAEWVKKNVIFKDKSMYSPKDDYGRMMEFLLSYSILGRNPSDDVPDGWAMFSEFVQTGFGASVKAIQNPLWGMR